MRTRFFRALILVLSLPSAFPSRYCYHAPCQRVAHAKRRAANTPMCTEDAAAAAKRRWLEARSGSADDRRPSERRAREAEEDIEARQREMEGARKRMVAAMGGPSDALSHKLSSFGAFGGIDDENYGYGPEESMRFQDEDEEIAEEQRDEFLPTWLTTDPVNARDAKSNLHLGGFDGLTEGGFDGRPDGWARKPELVDPNPPRMANTLRAPGPSSIPVQAFEYGIGSQARESPEGSHVNSERRVPDGGVVRAEQTEAERIRRAKAKRRRS